MKKLRAGIIGMGLIGGQHVESIRRISDVEVAAVTIRNPERVSETEHRFNVKVYTDYREMLDKENLDVLHNCTPNALHYEMNKTALERGIHVYSEKPLATTIEEAKALTRLAREKGLANGVNFNYRSNALVQEMRVRVENGSAGKPLLIHGQYVQDWMLYDTDTNWRLDPEKGGKSRALADIGSHWFDTVQVVTGQKIKGVYARNFIAHPFRQGQKVETEDGSTILFELQDGTPGSVVVSQVSAGYKNHNAISVDCAHCSMRWNQEQSDRLMIGSREHGVQHIYPSAESVDPSIRQYVTLPSGHPVGWQDAHTNGIRMFYQSIFDNSYRNEKQPYSTFADATYIMQIIEACMLSSEEKRWVEVKEVE